MLHFALKRDKKKCVFKYITYSNYRNNCLKAKSSSSDKESIIVKVLGDLHVTELIRIEQKSDITVFALVLVLTF